MNLQADRILELARSKGVLRTRDVDSAGASRALLASLTDEGKLLKLGRGLYALPDRAASAYDSFAEVAARSENGVLCLLSALRGVRQCGAELRHFRSMTFGVRYP